MQIVSRMAVSILCLVTVAQAFCQEDANIGWSAQDGANGSLAGDDDPETMAFQLLQQSMKFGPRIKEHLLSERAMLRGEQNRLLEQLLKPEQLKPLSAQNSSATWMFAAQVYERAGQIDKSKMAFQEVLKKLISETGSGHSYVKTTTLQKVATGLSRLEDFETAVEAISAIEIDEKDSTHITGQGAVILPGSAARSYGLLLVTTMQADVGRYEEAKKLAATIPESNAKAAALFVIALRQAEKGYLEEAKDTVRSAVKVKKPRRLWFGKEPMVIEFAKEGPKSIPWMVYISMSLEGVALGGVDIQYCNGSRFCRGFG